MEPFRILIADDHQLFRNGVRALLQSHAGWEICGEASTGREAVAKAKELLPDIVILDISMPELNGVDAVRRIRMASKNTRILILSVFSICPSATTARRRTNHSGSAAKLWSAGRV